MFEGAFSLRGRIGRLNFFLNGVVMGLAAAAGAVVLAFAVLPARHDGIGMAFFGICLALLLIAVLWYSLSLHVRRIRDIGWDPVVVIVGWIALNLLDFVLAHAVPSLAVSRHGSGTPIAPLLNFALSMALLFVPGRSGADEDGRFDDSLPGGDPTVVAASRAGLRSGFGRRAISRELSRP